MSLIMAIEINSELCVTYSGKFSYLLHKKMFEHGNETKTKCLKFWKVYFLVRIYDKIVYEIISHSQSSYA